MYSKREDELQEARDRKISGLLNLNPAASYSSIRRPYSTIGAGGLNGRVRDGIGCDTSAIATGNRAAWLVLVMRARKYEHEPRTRTTINVFSHN
jgi:hypothetical protein